MADRILLIGHPSSFLMTTLVKCLHHDSSALRVVRIAPDAQALLENADGCKMFLLFVGEGETPSFVQSLSNKAQLQKSSLCLLGDRERVEATLDALPDGVVTHSFYRPVELRRVSEELVHLLGAGDQNQILRDLEAIGIDTDCALGYTGGDRQLYLVALRSFIREADAKREEIQQAMNVGRYERVQILVHSLKSNCRTIGALYLSEKARQQEMAARENRISDLIHNNPGFLQTYKQLVDDLRAIPGVCESETPSPQGEVASLKQLLEEIRDALDVYDTEKAAPLLQQASALANNNKINSTLSTVQKLLDNMETESALVELEALLPQI